MWFRTLFGSPKPNSASATRRRRATGARPFRERLQIELLEDRSLPSNYTFTDIGTGGGTTANDINSLGQVVGDAGPAFIWTNGVMTYLGTLGGLDSAASGINDRGQVVGWATTASNFGHAFLVTPEDTNADGAPDLWFRDTNADGINDLMRDLGTLPGMQGSVATDINEAGQVVGWSGSWSGPTGGSTRAFRWQDGTMIDLGTLGGRHNLANAINNAGQIVGSSEVQNSAIYHAFLWQNGVMTDLGVGQNQIYHDAADINDAGQVVVNAYSGLGFLWTPSTPNGTVGTFEDLPPLSRPFFVDTNTEASGINDAGQIVGASRQWNDEVGFGPDRAVLWSDGEPRDLNQETFGDPWNWSLLSAAAINDAGQIVGQTRDGHAYLLTPISEGMPQLTIGDVTITEGNSGTQAATFTVTLSTPSSQDVTVAYATANGTATAGSDYQPTSGTLTFAPGELSKTVTVLVNGDRLGEPNETFVVNLSNPTGAIIADGQGVGTIVDDEPRISISDVTKNEGRRNRTTLFTFTVTLSSAYDQPVTMSFQTVNGTATTGNNDYIAKSGTLTFAPGETTKTITITVKGDSKKEADETFYVDLTGLSDNALFTKDRGVGTILNDD